LWEERNNKIIILNAFNPIIIKRKTQTLIQRKEEERNNLYPPYPPTGRD